MEEEPNMMYKNREEQGQLLQQVLAASDIDCEDERIPGEGGARGGPEGTRRVGYMGSMSGADDAVYMEFRRDLSSAVGIIAYDPFDGNSGSAGGSQSHKERRMRTCFKDYQLRTMHAFFRINQNPDSNDIEQLEQKTGLPKRVVQVWFQNARAKWRRYTIRQKKMSVSSGSGSSNIGVDQPANKPSAPSQISSSSSTVQGQSIQSGPPPLNWQPKHETPPRTAPEAPDFKFWR